jgi:hypothetical protein
MLKAPKALNFDLSSGAQITKQTSEQTGILGTEDDWQMKGILIYKAVKVSTRNSHHQAETRYQEPGKSLY